VVVDVPVMYVGLDASVDPWPEGVPSQVKDLKQHVSKSFLEVILVV
jgi:hypothetical protein